MPELPEVEIARENLERWLKQRCIVEARVRDERVLRGQSRRRVEAVLRGARVRAVARRGKFLLWNLGPRGRVLTHLGMTGKFVLRTEGEPEPAAPCVDLRLGGRSRVLFCDPRRFGRFQLLADQDDGGLGALGIEPLEPNFTTAALQVMLGRARRSIKAFLLDQRRIAGLGNIHAAESLFLAGIHPARWASSLTSSEVRRLHRSIRRDLRSTLRAARADEMRYVQEREATNPFRIYGRSGEACPRCHAPIERGVQNGRSSYYCPVCQPFPNGVARSRRHSGTRRKS